jgi:diguanylate cyclase (GGDEF)-like protein
MLSADVLQTGGSVTEQFDARRLDDLIGLIDQLSAGGLDTRLQPSPAGDRLDAVIAGINLLADELSTMYQTLEERVAERTSALDQARVAMERMALNDALTGLANRTLLGDRISQAIARADRGARPPSVLVLDLDEFKTINDGLGHGAGDRILIEVARRLSSVVRETDTVARLGGDEFAVLMPDVAEDDALNIAERTLKELQRPYELGERTLWAGASVGLCLGQRGQNAEQLLRDADTAMYVAKGNGRGNIQLFRPEMHRAARERLQIASELAAAIAHDQLTLLYQPIVDMATERIVGAEALVRWDHPERGLLSPADFISVAEDSGYIIELGRWVLRTAIGQLNSWSQTLGDPSFQLHVNLSPVEVRWPGMAQFVLNTLEQLAVDPSRLALEISETGLMTGDLVGIEALLMLRRSGVGIEIDDFGTGYSSISYLRRLPIDTVKMDRTLIADIADDPAQISFVSAILRLIESVGLRTVVEGIETAEQAIMLQQLGCRYALGHHFSEPVSADELGWLLAGSPALDAVGNVLR